MRQFLTDGFHCDFMSFNKALKDALLLPPANVCLFDLYTMHLLHDRASIAPCRAIFTSQHRRHVEP